MSGISELDQITRAASGDRAAQAALVNRNMPIIFRVAYRMLQDRAEAEDVTQETFLRAWKHLPNWQPKAKFSTWACTVALNLCRDRLRKKKPVLMDELPERVDTALRPEEALASAQAQDRIATKIAALPERQREALTLCALEGMTNIEAAAAMDVSVRALESLLARARRTLRAGLHAERVGDAE
ncbi:MAG: sigma-70 family RNA polymerase sigma factor [Hyphomonadaceae bacterium]|nr:sigma-70 family RNA polymerase sigma factor [Hyphomonadaceae bacterium]